LGFKGSKKNSYITRIFIIIALHLASMESILKFKWMGQVAFMRGARNACKIYENVLLERPRHRWQGNIKIWGENMSWIGLRMKSYFRH
jgi:hypothetical protein